ncbi:hypothetical protein, partial [Escherichia coli]|uniref:hypothetical protein n=1 Tax=Escherichia coli TaxID=562 RepID=UPI003CE5B534
GTSNDIAEYLSRFDLPWDPFGDMVGLTNSHQTLTDAEKRVVQSQIQVVRAKDAQVAFLPKGTLRGQRYILVDEWGPYDFKRPILW